MIMGSLIPDLSTFTPEELESIRKNSPLLYELSERLAISRITSSSYFLMLPFILSLSILTSIIERLRQWMRKQRRGMVGLPFRERFPFDYEILCHEEAEAVFRRVKKLLRRWRFQEERGDGCILFTAQRGEVGFWGSIIFHFSFLVIIFGGMVSLLTHFQAEILLGVGQRVSLGDKDFCRIYKTPRIFRNFPNINISLEDFKAVYEDDRYPVDFSGDLVIENGSGMKRERIRVNNPVRYGGFQFTMERYGFSPHLIVMDGMGKVLLDAFIHLVVMTPEMRDSFSIPATPYRVTAQFFPDFSLARGKEDGRPRIVNKSIVPNNPAFHFMIEQEGKVVGHMWVPLGGQGRFREFTINFNDLSYWSLLGVTRNYGNPILVLGFLLCILGLSLRFIFYNRKIRGRIWVGQNASLIEMRGTCQYFPALFEQGMKRFVHKLEKGW